MMDETNYMTIIKSIYEINKPKSKGFIYSCRFSNLKMKYHYLKLNGFMNY